MYKSHRTAQMLNYFDQNDVRVRENPVTIDAQLLNIPAAQLDDIEQRVQREIDSRLVSTCPGLLDARGVYQAVKIPNSYILPPEGTDPVVEGLRRGAWKTLTRYDDRLPVPAWLEIDPDRSHVPLANPILMDVTGSGDEIRQIWNVQMAAPGALPLPNRLAFYIEGLANASGPLDIAIYGERYPQSAWVNERIKSHEESTTLRDGHMISKFAWAQVDSLVVKNLPSGARLRCWSIPFALPAYLDGDRAYTDPGYRDRPFPRYWSVGGGFLSEQFINNNFVGMEYIQSYSTPSTLIDISVEPHTWGMYAVSSRSLYYVDRREPMPDGLEQTGITAEPLFGIQVKYDQTKSGPTRYASIEPYPYGNAGTTVRFRYLMQDPQGNLFVVLSNGAVSPYAGSAGWKSGQPKSLSLPLLSTGTYIFTIECQGTNGQIYRDVFPYANLALNPLAILDLSNITSPVKGIAFDHLDRLWLWNGSFAIPLKLHYDGFVVDRSNNIIYLTDRFEQVRLS